MTLLGPALSQNFVAATVVNTATSNCDPSAGTIVNCVAITLDAVVLHPIGPSVKSGATTMPAGAPASQGYYVYVGFSDYDNNLIFGGGGGNGNVGDTAVYTPTAQGFANGQQGQTLDTLYVSSSAEPIVLTDYGTSDDLPIELAGFYDSNQLQRVCRSDGRCQHHGLRVGYACRAARNLSDAVRVDDVLAAKRPDHDHRQLGPHNLAKSGGGAGRPIVLFRFNGPGREHGSVDAKAKDAPMKLQRKTFVAGASAFRLDRLSAAAGRRRAVRAQVRQRAAAR